MTATLLRILDSRPEDIPSTWLIFNAPRPLYGHKCWEGEFSSGRYYAAIDPADEWGKTYIKETIRLDGYLVEYITEDTIHAWFQAECEREGYDAADFEWQDIRSQYFSEQGQIKIEVPV
jgi:hypothetical protein